MPHVNDLEIVGLEYVAHLKCFAIDFVSYNAIKSRTHSAVVLNALSCICSGGLAAGMITNIRLLSILVHEVGSSLSIEVEPLDDHPIGIQTIVCALREIWVHVRFVVVWTYLAFMLPVKTDLTTALFELYRKSHAHVEPASRNTVRSISFTNGAGRSSYWSEALSAGLSIMS